MSVKTKSVGASQQSIGDVLGSDLSDEEQEMVKSLPKKDRARYELQRKVQQKSEVMQLLTNLQSLRHQMIMAAFAALRN